ncbi:sulfotransferase family protein [Ancylobacter sp. SL191]|uniref:sulfotransferase family protein n=1 Tax=Ancylobacter sp. SL191 TaxID=2995166 RepID=UPI00226DA216|nr:hypothetical protein [Ancylobacter sp. SL191]WAC29197.1 hypothetical protein OU996_09310 [Ancylobacter sp. SL191]
MPHRRHACLVLGMHRSGTSALAHLLAELGADLPLRLNPPGPDNPEGYFEPAALVALHDRLLAAGGSAWFDLKPFALGAIPAEAARALLAEMAQVIAEDYPDAPLALIKDPRMCRFVPLAREVLGALGLEVAVVLALRHPSEVAASLARRDPMSATYAGFLWARHVIAAERDSRDLPRVTVGYADMMADWRDTAARIRSLPGPWRVEDPADAPLKAELRHHRGLDAVETFGPRLGPRLEALHDALTGLAGADNAAQHARIDAAARAVMAIATRESDLLEAEYLHRRLSTPNPLWASTDPAGDGAALAQLFDALHRAPAP